MRRMLSNCVPATTCSHSAPGPLALTHTGLSHSCNANTSAPTADPVANASAYRLGRTQNPMPARVMKKRLAESTYSNVRYSFSRRDGPRPESCGDVSTAYIAHRGAPVVRDKTSDHAKSQGVDLVSGEPFPKVVPDTGAAA
jgi:hypothetical protein